MKLTDEQLGLMAETANKLPYLLVFKGLMTDPTLLKLFQAEPEIEGDGEFECRIRLHAGVFLRICQIVVETLEDLKHDPIIGGAHKNNDVLPSVIGQLVVTGLAEMIINSPKYLALFKEMIEEKLKEILCLGS